MNTPVWRLSPADPESIETEEWRADYEVRTSARGACCISAATRDSFKLESRERFTSLHVIGGATSGSRRFSARVVIEEPVAGKTALDKLGAELA